jgi:aminoglycoside phosphotransferase (APT) family kinase protein
VSVLPAVAAARSVVSSLGLVVEDTIVLQESNRITVRLLPCDVLARVSRAGRRAARFLAGDDRDLLASTLRRLRASVGERGRAEQVLHGEPHPGNVLLTRDGPLFIDLETCCRGPVEFDLAHAPEEVGAHYPGADHHLLRDCRLLTLAMVTAWRWDRDDRLPHGRRLAAEWLTRIQAHH